MSYRSEDSTKVFSIPGPFQVLFQVLFLGIVLGVEAGTKIFGVRGMFKENSREISWLLKCHCSVVYN